MNIPNQAPMVDLNKTTPVVCNYCGGEVFRQDLKLRKVSAIVSPTGKEMVVFSQVFTCVKCNEQLTNPESNNDGTE